MKKLLLLICLFALANNTYAQEPALIDVDWYVDYVVLDDVTHENPIVNAIGIINANLFLDEVSVGGVIHPESDSFFGDVIYDPVDPAFSFINMGITLPGCQNYCEFAAKYFDFLVDDFIEANFTYEILTNGDGKQTLIMTRDDGNFAVFQDSKILGLNDNALSTVRLFPNPTTDLLFIDSEFDTIQQLSVYDSTGRQVLNMTPEENSIDVSILPQGLYFLEVIMVSHKTVQKFIKR